MEKGEIACPACLSKAVYRYGNIGNGKKRYLCLMCGRQFTPDKARSEIYARPACPVCGKKMHSYRRCPGGRRFRCSGYPECKVYKKVASKEGLTE